MKYLFGLFRRSGRYENVVVLGGGGAKGLAHIGVLKAIEEKNIKISAIVGCSMGALIGGVYALNPSATDMESIVNRINFKKLIAIRPSPFGIFDAKRIDKLLKKLFDDVQFSHLKIPLYVNAFDINKFEHVVFHEGYVRNAVRASISVPGLFPPISMNGRILVDGGIYETLPLSIAYSLKPKKVIAINVLGGRQIETMFMNSNNINSVDIRALKENNIMNISLRAIISLQLSQIQHTLQMFKPNILIDVNVNHPPFDFENIDVKAIINEGYSVAMQKL